MTIYTSGKPLGFTFEDHLTGKFLDVSVLAFTLGLYFLSIPLEFVPLTTGASISKYVAVLPLTAAFLNLKNLRFRNRWLTASMLCLALITLGSGLVSPLHIPFSNYIALLINIAFTVLLGSFDMSKKDIEFLRKCLVVSSVIALVFLLLFSSTYKNTGRDSISIAGAAQDPNYLCGCFVFGVAYCVHDYMSRGSKVGLIMTCLFLMGVFTTGSRGGLVAIASVIVSLLLLDLSRLRKNLKPFARIVLIAVALLIAFNIIMSILPQDISERYTIEYLIENGNTHRSLLQQQCLSAFSDFDVLGKLFGMGLGATRFFNSFHNVAHNVWVETLIGMGIVGVLLTALVYFIVFKTALKLKDFKIAASLVGMFVLGLSLSTVYFKPVWALILFAAIRFGNQDDADEKGTS